MSEEKSNNEINSEKIQNIAFSKRDKKNSGLYIAGIIITSLLIISLIVLNFIFSEKRFQITSSIIICLCLLIILVLSKSFDNFSIGKIISISREAKKNEEKVCKLEKEKESLLLQLNTSVFQNMQLASLSFQHQNNSNIFNIGDLYNVKKDSPDTEAENNPEDSVSKQEKKNSFKERELDRKKIISCILKKRFKNEDITEGVSIVRSLPLTDAISIKPVHFDAYFIDNSNSEKFVTIINCFLTSSPISYHDKVYIQLNRIINYNLSRNSNAKLHLLLAIEEGRNINDDNLQTYLTPAQNSNLLTIEHIYLTKEDIEKCTINKKNNHTIKSK